MGITKYDLRSRKVSCGRAAGNFSIVNTMQQYLGLLEDVLTNGVGREDRTGTGTIGVFGRQIRCDLREGFPCLTTKKLHLRSII